MRLSKAPGAVPVRATGTGAPGVRTSESSRGSRAPRRRGPVELRARLLDIYERLYEWFGPRGWWPAETPFEVIVGAILVQNVAWKNAARAVANLKAAGLLEPAALHSAPLERVEELVRPSGFFRSKARKLRAFTAHLFERYGGDLAAMFRRPLAELREELLGVHGIGEETADDILCYAGNYPIMVMDAYTRRVFSRLGLVAPDARYAEMQALFMDHLPHDVRLFNEYHALIDGLAHCVCLKTAPRCGYCPLAELCPRVGV